MALTDTRAKINEAGGSNGVQNPKCSGSQTVSLLVGKSENGECFQMQQL